MSSDHPSPGTLQRFLRGQATPEENLAIVPHLIAGCPHCLEVTRSAWFQSGGLCGRAWPSPAPVPTVHPSSYAEIWERVEKARERCEHRLVTESQQAPVLLRELLALPAARRIPSICGEERWWSFYLGQLLIAEGSRRGLDSPQSSAELAEAAIAITERLDSRIFGEAAIHDLAAGAWSVFGSARRRLGDPRGAERAFAVAEARLRHGTGDPVERAELLLQRAALHRDQRRFEEALRLLRRARVAHRGLADDHFLGRVLVERGRVLSWAGDAEEAICALRQAFGQLDPRQEPRYVFEVALDLGHLLVDTGRTSEAARLLQQVQDLEHDVIGHHGPQRLTRLEGRVLLALGRTEAAEEASRRARLGLLAVGLGHEAALAALDLAMLYARRADPAALRRLGQELLLERMTPELGADGLVVLEILERLTRTERTTHGLIAQLGAHLRRVRAASW